MYIADTAFFNDYKKPTSCWAWEFGFWFYGHEFYWWATECALGDPNAADAETHAFDTKQFYL